MEVSTRGFYHFFTLDNRGWKKAVLLVARGSLSKCLVFAEMHPLRLSKRELDIFCGDMKQGYVRLILGCYYSLGLWPK